MPNNGNDGARLYQDAMQAQLGERVTNLGRRQTDLENEMRTGFRQMETSITRSPTRRELRSGSSLKHWRIATSHNGRQSASH